MKFELHSGSIGRLIGMGVAVAVTVSWTTASQILRTKENGVSVTTNGAKVPQSAGNEESNTVMIPFNDTVSDSLQDDSGKLYEVYSKIIQSEQKKNRSALTPNRAEQFPQTAISDEPAVTVFNETETTAQTTTSSAEAAPETDITESSAERTVSNGKLPFNYNDVSSIAVNMNELDDFVNKLNPASLAWDTSDYPEHGCVHITLASVYGVVVLDVKPLQETEALEPYAINGDISGSVNANTLSEWDWYQKNKNSGCSLRSVTWLKAGFAVAPVRGIDVGAGLGELTGQYLCVNGGGTTLYKAADVITNEEKLNTLMASENAYTFVGGRLYTISGYLDKYYNGKSNSYQFADCDMVVQYGCNSIVDHNYISGSWIIEYAIKDDVVTGITFMNKSYYKKREVHGGATSSSTSSTSIAVDKENKDTASTTLASVTETTTTATAAESGESTAETQPTDSTTTETIPKALG